MYHVTQSFRDLGCHLGCHEVAANKRYTGSPPSVLPSLRRRITRVRLGGTGTHTGQGCADDHTFVTIHRHICSGLAARASNHQTGMNG